MRYINVRLTYLLTLLFVLLLWVASIVEPMAFLVACHI